MPSVRALENQSPGAPESENENEIRILFVDDDAAFRSLCRRYMGRYTAVRYEFTEVASGTEACEQYAHHDFDCVLVDYRLPDMTGLAVMRALQPKYDPRIPMILLTAEGSEEIAAEALHAGAVDYLPKNSVSGHSLNRAIHNAVEKARLHRRIEDRNEQLEGANSELNKRNDEIRRFYHTVSHEIKTPLTAAREFIAIVLDGIVGDTTKEQREMLSHALDSCDQIARHFSDLIESARLDTGKMRLSLELSRVDTTVLRSVTAVSPAARAKQMDLESNVEPDLPKLKIDSGRIVQVISNLLTNAVKFTAPGGRVAVSARRINIPTDCVEIEVRDTGCGIKGEDLPHVFERLYQVDEHVDSLLTEGLGLGLSIAKEIVLLHGGEISVRSDIGIGTSFQVRLPVPSDSNVD